MDLHARAPSNCDSGTLAQGFLICSNAVPSLSNSSIWTDKINFKSNTSPPLILLYGWQTPLGFSISSILFEGILPCFHVCAFDGLPGHFLSWISSSCFGEASVLGLTKLHELLWRAQVNEEVSAMHLSWCSQGKLTAISTVHIHHTVSDIFHWGCGLLPKHVTLSVSSPQASLIATSESWIATSVETFEF